jgi:hypothetical protein
MSPSTTTGLEQLPLNLGPAPHADAVGFDLGMDHARLGLFPVDESATPQAALRSGWQAGRATFGRRDVRATSAQRLWLRERVQAWRAGVLFDARSLSPALLHAIKPSHCPVTRAPLGGAPGNATAPVLLSTSADGRLAAGCVVWVSQRAAAAETLSDEELRRLLALRALAMPLPHAQAAALPLRLLPPPGLCVANAAQRLQCLLTSTLARPGWGGRLRQWAELLAAGSARQDYQLLVGALAARALELPAAEGASALKLQHALEDLWACPRVQQRWSVLALELSEAGCQALWERLTRRQSTTRGPAAGQPGRVGPAEPARPAA